MFENETNEVNEVEQPDVSTETVETPEVPTEVEAVEAPEGEKEGSEEAPAKEVAAEPAYQPNFKFKVYDKEHEIPEKFRSLIKTPEDEREIRDIFEKSIGLEGMKPKYQKAKERAERADHYEREVLPKYAEQDKIINKLVGFIKNKDFDSYFEALGVPEKEIQEWQYKKLSLTPEQRELYNKNRELQKQLYQQTDETQKLSASAEQAKREAQAIQIQKMSEQLDYTLSRNEFAEVSKSYDEKHGKDAFKMRVIKHADYILNTEGKDLGFEGAAKDLLENYMPAMAKQSAQNTKNVLASSKDKPVLPAVKAKPISPAASSINSIQALREKAERMLSGD